MRILFSLLLSAFVATAANATNPAYTDDLKCHATFVGEMRNNHTVKPGAEIPEGVYVHFDSRLPSDMQLITRLRGQLMSYTCPAVPGVPGLEDPRPMGSCPEFFITGNETKIEVIRAAYDNQDMQPLPGFYRSLGVIQLASVLESGVRVSTLRMHCRSGVEDGLPVTIDFKETTHILATPLSLNTLGSRNLNLAGSSIQACTLSFWYQLDGTITKDGDLPLFKFRGPAKEKGLEGKTKEIACLIKQNSSDNSLSLKFPYPMLSAGERSVMGPEYKNVDEEVRKTKPVKASWGAISKEQAITYMRTRKLPKGYSAAYGETFLTIFNNVRLGWANKLASGKGMSWEFIRNFWENSGQHGLWKAVPYMAKTGKKIKKATGKNIEVSKEKISLMRNESFWTESLSEETKFNIVFSLSLAPKRIRAYINGEKLWTLNLDDQFGIQTLQDLGELSFGDHAAKIAGGVFMEGEHGPKTFGCFNSHGLWVPKKLETPLGAKGFVLAAATPRPAPQGPTATNAAPAAKAAAKEPTKVAKRPAKVAKGPAKVAKGPAKVAKGPAKVAKGPAKVAKAPDKLAKAPAKKGPGKK